MPFVKAGPNEYLLVGRKGTMENRGSAIRPFLRPGTVWVLVPSTKQEATFEFTQETKDGIPLRFKGIVIYRITDPLVAARLFSFDDDGVDEITGQLTHISLGELRHAVSHMTMAECIEQRKTTLSGVVATAMQQTLHNGDGGANTWGIEVEVAQVAQVYIVDGTIRAQLEAEVRNEIKVKSDQSGIKSKEEIRLTEMASENRVLDQQLAADKAELLRAQDRLAAELAAEKERLASETPVKLAKTEAELAIARQELELQRLRVEVRELTVEADLILERARQELRREMLPIEQAPQIVESAAKILQGTNLSVYGDGSEVLGQLAPMFELLTRSVRQAVRAE